MRYLSILLLISCGPRYSVNYGTGTIETQAVLKNAHNLIYTNGAGFEPDLENFKHGEVEQMAQAINVILCKKDPIRFIASCASHCAYNRHFVSDYDTEDGPFGIGLGTCKKSLVAK